MPVDAAEEYSDPGKFWHDQINHAVKIFQDWQNRGEKVVDRYRDERSATERLRTKFSILWSNVQVLTPSLYGRPAKPEVSRRYMDQDVIGRLASTILERVLEYECTQFPDFDAAMVSAVQDRLLPGRGTAWVRYDPVIVTEQLEAPEGTEITNTEPVVNERIDSAHAPVDYVFWKDFIHSPARTWDEVWWVARWVYMTEEEGVARFGDVFRNVPLNSTGTEGADPKNSRLKSGIAKKARIAEIWNKRTARVCWVAQDYPQSLDERDDPLQLEGFFPCPKPLFSTMTNGTLIPVPDYIEYEDQAQELDSITGRITNLVKAVKAVGVFNAEYKEVGRLLSEGIDNKLLPVTNWAALTEKGGLDGAVDMLDLSTVIQALGVLYKAREDVKQTIYEICGISDILRGATKAEETLGAQQLKANFGSLRLKQAQTDVARFASDLFRLKAQIICQFYPESLLIQMSGIQGTSDGQDPAALQRAIRMLQNSTVRDFHISVESDSLAQIDDQAEKSAASEAIQAIGVFLKEAMPMVAAAPETLPMVSEMLLFLVRRYRTGRALESAIERAMRMLEQKAMMSQQNPPPSEIEIEGRMRQQSDQMRVQADVQAAQAKAQMDASVQQAKLQMEMRLEEMKAQQTAQLAKIEAQIKLAQIDAENKNEWRIAQLDSITKIRVAEISAESKAENDMESSAPTTPVPASPPVVNMTVAVKKPVKRKVERDASGRISGIVEEELSNTPEMTVKGE